MQVFLPFPSFQQSVACLDKKRLGNQIWRECKTLISGGWPNHPVAKMWADYKPALVCYMYNGVQQLHDRNWIEDNRYVSLREEVLLLIINKYNYAFDLTSATLKPEYNPPFIGNEEFHRSHRLNLLWKDSEWYRNYFTDPVPTCKPDYIWPLIHPDVPST